MTISKNYLGKEVFVGIDVHKLTYHVSCLCDGTKMKLDHPPYLRANLD